MCVFGSSGSVLLCDDAQTSAACMSFYFGLSLKCVWNVVPDQHTDTTGLTSKLNSTLILLCGLSDYTFRLCVHYEFLQPDVWWVKMNIILCFYQFLYFKPLTFDVCLKAVIPAAFCLVVCQWMTEGHIGAFCAFFMTLILCYCFDCSCLIIQCEVSHHLG